MSVEQQVNSQYIPSGSNEDDFFSGLPQHFKATLQALNNSGVKADADIRPLS